MLRSHLCPCSAARSLPRLPSMCIHAALSVSEPRTLSLSWLAAPVSLRRAVCIERHCRRLPRISPSSGDAPAQIRLRDRRRRDDRKTFHRNLTLHDETCLTIMHDRRSMHSDWALTPPLGPHRSDVDSSIALLPARSLACLSGGSRISASAQRRSPFCLSARSSPPKRSHSPFLANSPRSAGFWA